MKTLLFLALLILVSCGESETEATNEQAKPTEPSSEKHMLSDQEKMIQKAKETEAKIKEADEKRRKALEDQGG